MWLTEKIFGSDKKLSRPDINKSNRVSCNFSENYLNFLDPEQTSLTPYFEVVKKLELTEEKEFCKDSKGNLAKPFYQRGWDFFGKARSRVGGVYCIGTISHYSERGQGASNLFIQNSLLDIVVDWCCSFFEEENRSKIVHAASTLRKNNVEWLVVQRVDSLGVTEIYYFSPLALNDLLVLSFRCEAYAGYDFDSPETNLKETCFQVVDEFINNFHIEYSEESKKAMAEAKGK